MTTLALLSKDVQKDMADLSRYIAIERLEDLLRQPLLQMNEPIACILPSLVLAGDGPVLSRMVVATKHYICEIRNSSQDVQDYDFAARDSIENYRISVSKQELREGDVVRNTFYLATITWSHNSDLHTRLEFAGASVDDRDRWISSVLRAMPVSSVLRREPLR